MERSTLTPFDLRFEAERNLVDTYLRLGTATPGSRLVDDPGFVACLGDMEHPVCNFAVDLKLDPNSARRLAAIAAPRPAFHVYCFDNRNSEYEMDLLRYAGFEQGSRLMMMGWAPDGYSPVDDELEEEVAESSCDRKDIARFMVMQFFAERSAQYRAPIEIATSEARSLELLWFEDKGQTVGACLLGSAIDAIGVYNLCISAPLRGRGYGRAVIEKLKKKASLKRAHLTLQCEPRLACWYERQGFAVLGEVLIYGLPSGKRIDIIRST